MFWKDRETAALQKLGVGFKLMREKEKEQERRNERHGEQGGVELGVLELVGHYWSRRLTSWQVKLKLKRDARKVTV